MRLMLIFFLVTLKALPITGLGSVATYCLNKMALCEFSQCCCLPEEEVSKGCCANNNDSTANEEGQPAAPQTEGRAPACCAEIESSPVAIFAPRTDVPNVATAVIGQPFHQIKLYGFDESAELLPKIFPPGFLTPWSHSGRLSLLQSYRL